MQLNAYLNFNGQCEAAFKFYEKVLGGKILFMQTWGNSPLATSSANRSRGQFAMPFLYIGDSIPAVRKLSKARQPCIAPVQLLFGS